MEQHEDARYIMGETSQHIQQLYEEAKQNSEERSALLKIARALSTPEALRDLQTVYETIYKQVQQIMPVDAFFISRYNAQHDLLVMDYLIDEGATYPPIEYTPPISQCREFFVRKAAHVLFSTQQDYAEFTKDDHKDLPEGEDLIGGQKLSESLLFVSLRHGDELIGILSVQSYQPNAYTPRHLYLLEEIGVQAAIAISNARLYTELREAVKQAQESEQLKNHFLMTAAHELRTPLTAVDGYLELLHIRYEDLSDEERKRFITHAYRASEELILLMGNVMDTSRIGQDIVNLHLETVSVLQTALLMQDIFAPILSNEFRTLDISLAGDLFVCADELRLRQILLNVVGNALKYTPVATNIAIYAERVARETLCQRIPTEVAISSDEQTQFVLLSIRDWGDGIAPADQPLLFNKFIRLANAMNSTKRGAGLGLYLCRQLMEAMGGYIWVESTGRVGEGAIFQLALPVARVLHSNGV